MRYINSILFCLFLALQLPASGSVVAYWEFDSDGTTWTNAAVGGSTYNLTQLGSSYAGNAANIATITNPDTTNGPDDPGATNDGSILSAGDENGYLVGGSGSRDKLRLNGTSWTFEGWLNVGSGGQGRSSLDTVFTTRNGISGPGILFDVRNDGAQSYFSLYVDDGGNESFNSPSFNREETFHFALTWKSGNFGPGTTGQFELFRNGTSQGTEDLTLDLAAADTIGNDKLYLLGRLNDVDGSFNGSADEFRISDTALTPGQFLNAVVPEPGTGLLFLLGGLMALWVRRMRRA